MGRAVRIVPFPGPGARGRVWVIGSLVPLPGRATILSADKANEFLAPAWTCRPDALTRDTGWRAETALEAGLQRTAERYRSHGWLSYRPGDSEGSRPSTSRATSPPSST